MKKLMAPFVSVCALTAATAASAQDVAVVTTDLNMRAGPSSRFPVISALPAEVRVNIYGCVDGFEWCDVEWRGNRGWVFADYLNYRYDGRFVPVVDYGPRIGIDIVDFSVDTYWGEHYRERPWYDNRSRWIAIWDREGRDYRRRDGDRFDRDRDRDRSDRLGDRERPDRDRDRDDRAERDRDGDRDRDLDRSRENERDRADRDRGDRDNRAERNRRDRADDDDGTRSRDRASGGGRDRDDAGGYGYRDSDRNQQQGRTGTGAAEGGPPATGGERSGAPGASVGGNPAGKGSDAGGATSGGAGAGSNGAAGAP